MDLNLQIMFHELYDEQHFNTVFEHLKYLSITTYIVFLYHI